MRTVQGISLRLNCRSSNSMCRICQWSAFPVHNWRRVCMHGMYRLRCSLWLVVAVHSQLVWHYKPLCDGSGTVEETLAVFNWSSGLHW